MNKNETIVLIAGIIICIIAGYFIGRYAIPNLMPKDNQLPDIVCCEDICANWGWVQVHGTMIKNCSRNYCERIDLITSKEQFCSEMKTIIEMEG